MAAATDKTALEKTPDGVGAGAVYALVHLLHAGRRFLPGDRIDEHHPAGVLEGLLERGEASRTKPASLVVVAAGE